MYWQSLLADFLWILGLAVVLATVSYTVWLAPVTNRPLRVVMHTPRFLAPLCIGIEFFSIGMAMTGLAAFRHSPWWETLAWSIFVILFGIQAIMYSLAGARYGWDTPVKEEKS